MCVALFSTLLPVNSSPTTAEDFLERAKEHYTRRRFLNTLDSLKVVLQMTEHADARSNPTKREAEILAAKSLAALDRKAEAANMFERAVAHGFVDNAAFTFLATYYDDHAEWQKAKRYFALYFAVEKKDSATQIRYATLLGRLGEREKAREILEGIETRTPQLSLEDCELLERKKKLTAAKDCFLEYRDTHPDREVGYLALFRLSKALKQPEETLRAAKTLYFIFGAKTRFIWPLVETYLESRKFYDARLLLEEIVRTDGKESDAQKLLEKLNYEAGEAAAKPFRATPQEMQLLESIKQE